MGFLSRLRQGSAYGPPPAAGPNGATTQPGNDPMPGTTPQPPAPAAAGNRISTVNAMPAIGRPAPGQLTTAAERAFMEARRGSSE